MLGTEMTYNHIFEERQNAFSKLFKHVTSLQLPVHASSASQVEALLHHLALSDANNFTKAGVGEREGRVLSGLVRGRNYGFAHGAGRSGSLLDQQPKAAGSNLLNAIGCAFLKKALQLQLYVVKSAAVVPFCTGMTFNFLIQALRLKRVAWLRADQKSIPKALLLAGAHIQVLEPVWDGESLSFDLEQLKGLDDLDCVISTTSCFAPRCPDDVGRVGEFCKARGITHLVNNAYGIQSQVVAKRLSNAHYDFAVSSLDKSFCVPVGGACLYSARREVADVLKQFPGRAAAAGMDLVITLLELGQDGFLALQAQRRQLFAYFVAEMRKVEQVEVHEVKGNDISFYWTLKAGGDAMKISAALFRAGVSGSRCLRRGEVFQLGEHLLEDFGRGAAYEAPPYVTCAAAVGMAASEVDFYVCTLRKLLAKLE